ncbi:MAG TPA: hypothetical protein VNR38_16965 [Ureibacillus sp.]|nr:hypothetical protein [Ureibacillus sp.]
MEDLFTAIFGIFVISGILMLIIMWTVSLFQLAISETKAFMRWLNMTPKQRQNHQKMKKTVRRIKGQSKYGTSYADGGSYYSSYSCGDSGGDSGGCD